MNPTETIKSRFDGIWHCAFTKKCGWKGQHSELVDLPDPKDSRVKRGGCPKCLQHKKGFYVRDEQGKPL